MRVNNISQILDAAIILSFVIAIAFLISIVVPNSYGITIGILIVLITVLSFFTKKRFNIPQGLSDLRITLLLYIVICMGSIVSVFTVGERFVPFFLSCSFAGLMGIINWGVKKKWRGKAIASIFKEDFHLLPPSVDIAIVIFNILDILLRNGELSVSTIVINSMLLLDGVIQTIYKHNNRKSSV